MNKRTFTVEWSDDHFEEYYANVEICSNVLSKSSTLSKAWMRPTADVSALRPCVYMQSGRPAYIWGGDNDNNLTHRTRRKAMYRAEAQERRSRSRRDSRKYKQDWELVLSPQGIIGEGIEG